MLIDVRRMTGRTVLSFLTMASVSLIRWGVPTVAGLVISLSAWHKARRLDASAHQAEKQNAHTMYAFMDACVVIFGRSNEETVSPLCIVTTFS